MQRYIPLIMFVVICNALSQALLKAGMAGIGAFRLSQATAGATVVRILSDPYVLGGLSLMIVSMAGHLYVLSRVPLSFAFPFISVSYLVVLAISWYVFDERLNAYHFAGTFCICLGVLCIARAGSESVVAAAGASQAAHVASPHERSR
ncbi:MAG: EamA family transporter [Pseudomonadales bacterium]|nr:EamA family transporter [Pseudomonadales bacterium]